MPRASAVTILCDPETMYPISIMEGVIISHMRTGAMTGVGAKYLAKKGPAVVGIIGAGPIARTTLMALNAAIDQIQKVKLFDLSDQRARLFKEELGKELGVDIQIVKSAEEAVREADIFAPATNVGPGESYIEYRWLKQGCFFSDPSMYDEKDEVILKADKVVINNYQTLENPHDRLAPLIADKRFSKERAIDFGSIIAGKAKGRENDKEIIVFCPRGMCIFDICNAYRIYKTAKARGVGQLLPLWSKPLWI
jgi:ornithine cyclodeaminase